MDDFSSKNSRDPILAQPAFNLQADSALGRGVLAGAMRATPYAQALIAAATQRLYASLPATGTGPRGSSRSMLA